MCCNGNEDVVSERWYGHSILKSGRGNVAAAAVEIDPATGGRWNTLLRATQ